MNELIKNFDIIIDDLREERKTSESVQNFLNLY